MAKYAWTITRDCVPMQGKEPHMNVVGVIGPTETEYWRSICNTPVCGYETIIQDPSRRIFQLYDAQDVLRYEGYMVFNGDEQATGTEPLTEFGQPYAGCTKIRYRNIDSGEWEWL